MACAGTRRLRSRRGGSTRSTLTPTRRRGRSRGARVRRCKKALKLVDKKLRQPGAISQEYRSLPVHAHTPIWFRNDLLSTNPLLLKSGKKGCVPELRTVYCCS
ncbi:hypothetical protein GQ55_8G047900 [Panicum hallii var. hallii]|uniref:Uncharacterized protein n=1 Tax=Panicum hallii var. hallii TaxID=1504633 RepID=A0A2T7CKS8_9POAL|nr:hypothetical protein GQ55_8G047900 [Panicum hallii var. hallii]